MWGDLVISNQNFFITDFFAILCSDLETSEFFITEFEQKRFGVFMFLLRHLYNLGPKLFLIYTIAMFILIKITLNIFLQIFLQTILNFLQK